MFPPILLSIPYTILMGKLGLTNSRIGLIIMYLSFSVPYAVWLLIGFFKTVPLGIEEAARVDGANKLQVFVRVVLPNVAPGVVAVAIYTFINAWNEFLYALLILNSRELMTVSVALKSLEGQEVMDWGVMMTRCDSGSGVLYADSKKDCRRLDGRICQVRSNPAWKPQKST